MKTTWKQKQEMSFQIAWLNKLSNDTAVITAPVEPWKTLESLPSMHGGPSQNLGSETHLTELQMLIKVIDLMPISGMNGKMRIMRIMLVIRYSVLIFQACWNIFHLFSILTTANPLYFDFYCTLLLGALCAMYWQINQSKRLQRLKKEE